MEDRCWGPLVSLAANCGFLAGCISRGAVTLCLYRVKVAVLAEGLQKLAYNGTQNVPELLHPELPTYWYWGMSGVCDVYDSKDETRCRRQFPPTNNLITIVEEFLRDGLGSGQESLVNNIVSSWNTTLNNISPSKLRDKEAKFTAENKAGAALALLAIFLDGAVLLLGLLLGEYPTLPYVAAFFSAMISVGAGTLATYSMYDGVHGVIDTGEHGGLGIILLFVGVALRIFSSIIGLCCRSHRDPRGDTEGGLPPRPPSNNLPTYNNTVNIILPPGYPSRNSTGAHPEHYPWSHAEAHAGGYSEGHELGPLDYKHEIGLDGEKHLYKILIPLPFFAFPHANHGGTYYLPRFEALERKGLPNWSWEEWTSSLRAWAGYPRFTDDKDFTDFTYTDHSGAMREKLREWGVPIDTR